MHTSERTRTCARAHAHMRPGAFVRARVRVPRRVQSGPAYACYVGCEAAHHATNESLHGLCRALLFIPLLFIPSPPHTAFCHKRYVGCEAARRARGARRRTRARSPGPAAGSSEPSPRPRWLAAGGVSRSLHARARTHDARTAGASGAVGLWWNANARDVNRSGRGGKQCGTCDAVEFVKAIYGWHRVVTKNGWTCRLNGDLIMQNKLP